MSLSFKVSAVLPNGKVVSLEVSNLKNAGMVPKIAKKFLQKYMEVEEKCQAKLVQRRV